MIETKTIKTMKCDLCLKELDKKKHYKKYLPLSLKIMDWLFGTDAPDLCKACWDDTIKFISNHRTYYSLKENENEY